MMTASSEQDNSREIQEGLPGLSAAVVMGKTVRGIGLNGVIRIEPTMSKSGKEIVKVQGRRQQVVDPAMAELIKRGSERATENLIKQLALAFSSERGNVTASHLLGKPEYGQAALLDRTDRELKANRILAQLSGSGERIPTSYGSTSGLNMAELLETVICAQTAQERLGLRTAVVFDHGGHQSKRAQEMLNDSLVALPRVLGARFEAFSEQLGAIEEQRLRAARELLVLAGFDLPVTFLGSNELTEALGPIFTLGKLFVLAELAGSNPGLFREKGVFSLEERLEDYVGLVRITQMNQLSRPISSLAKELAGFGYYGREAVVAADVEGNYLMPFKMTSHANIYKVLGSYGGLIGQRADGGGAIICPIRRERIQTRQQAAEGSDPVDVTVLAFLARQYPEGWEKMMVDFRAGCQVLTADEAVKNGDREHKFVVENYFPVSGRRISSTGG